MEAEALKTLIELGTQGLLLWLYVRADGRLQLISDTYRADMKELNERRVSDIQKLTTRTPTNLEG